MKEVFSKLKRLVAGKWKGQGFARYPTIVDTAYTEESEFVPDEYKDAIFFAQKSWYKNDTGENGHTVFWDTGFIILKDDKIVLHSVQIGGRIETYDLANNGEDWFTFESRSIIEDVKTIRSQRVFRATETGIHYDLNMSTHAADFQNHLQANLIRME